jgi:hypothetical protein
MTTLKQALAELDAIKQGIDGLCAETQTANDTQVGGAHYKQHTYETWDVILDWQLGYLDGNAVKYLSRWRSKGGVQDLKKAAHYIQKLIEVEEANGNS